MKASASKGEISLQLEDDALDSPAAEQIQAWVSHTLASEQHQGDIAILLVGKERMTELNQTYRDKSGPTNVLSFPAELPPGVPVNILGDIVICAPLVAEEAAQQGKSVQSHWAHLLVHGTLHLLGYDHMEDREAEQMEAREIGILADLGFPNPYG